MAISLATSLIAGLLLGGVYAAMSVGFSLAMSTAHTLNLSHTTIALIASYVAYFGSKRLGLDPLVSLLLLLPAMFALGLALYYTLIRPTVRRSRDPAMATAVLTMGLSIVIENLISVAWTPNARLITTPYSGRAFTVGGATVQISHLIAFAVAVVCIGLVHLFLHHTSEGRAVQAIAQDPDGARLQGIQVTRISALAFGVGTATAAAGGVTVALLFAFNPTAYFEWLLWVFLVVVVAGAGAIRGTLWAGLIIGAIIGLSGALIPNVWLNLVLFSGLILVLLVRPSGLFRS